ncbi:hypothetical protein, partial [Bacillus cereus]|uniref:hypothetical protein n=1 Tax=Bacillus cereus TaxID=1396 RepID=UPI001C54E5C6
MSKGNKKDSLEFSGWNFVLCPIVPRILAVLLTHKKRHPKVPSSYLNHFNFWTFILIEWKVEML